ncbi:MAG: hypothetical protein LC637_05650 [Xanthomonadaceae bacterium]|nr:hypothetical protein [Xanthomonadaceae bacterium]
MSLPTRTSLRAPLLGELLEPSGSRSRRVWLDLGSVTQGLIERLQNTRSRLVIAALDAAAREREPDCFDFKKRFAAGLLNEPVDTVLCWDLLNYMNANQLQCLSATVARLAGPGARIHALIYYSNPMMPDLPGRFFPGSGAELEMIEGARSKIQALRYSPKALQKAMPKLEVERTLLLNNGMQEFIFELRLD